MDVCPTKAPGWCLGSALQCLCVLPRACGAACVARYSGWVSYQGAAVGPRRLVALCLCVCVCVSNDGLVGSVLQWVGVLPRPCGGA